MKSKSWKKEYIVINYSDYDNTWSILTIPLTVKQAYNFLVVGRYLSRFDKDLIKIVTLTEWEKMQEVANV